MKTIDVMEEDTFYADFYLCQKRGFEYRNIELGGPSPWTAFTQWGANPDLRYVPRKDALLMLRMGGYTLTPGEGEKPAAKPADHIGKANEMVPANPAPTVKPD
jgi:hypothetical protein